jgi:hypothetical protein
MKVYGAHIYCCICHAEPWPEPGSGYREDFGLRRLNDDGRPAASPAKGAWYCREHAPAEKPKASREAAKAAETAKNGGPAESKAPGGPLNTDHTTREHAKAPTDGTTA